MTSAELFRSHFGAEPTVSAFAPGRVNLIGEYTDFNGGFVMPIALNQGITASARITDGPTRIVSTLLGESDPFDVKEVYPRKLSHSNFDRYAAGMAWAMKDFFTTTGSPVELPNLEIALDSDLPVGSGVSSSAALEMVIGTLWLSLIERTLEPAQLAVLGQVCENLYVGVKSGIMDQLASACGRRDHAMLIDTRNRKITYAEIPSEYAVLILNTEKPRELTGSAYNERRQQCETAATALGLEYLRDATLELLEQKKFNMEPLVYRRARHVITENSRTLALIDCLANRDHQGIFAILKASHDSLRHDFEVSCLELDAMVGSAWLSPGIVGARLTGAGFGGCAVAIVHADQIEEFSAHCLNMYRERTAESGSPREGSILVCHASDGARLLTE